MESLWCALSAEIPELSTEQFLEEAKQHAATARRRLADIQSLAVDPRRSAALVTGLFGRHLRGQRDPCLDGQVKKLAAVVRIELEPEEEPALWLLPGGRAGRWRIRRSAAAAAPR